VSEWVTQITPVVRLLWEAGSLGRGHFGNPEGGECSPLEADTKQGLVKTNTDWDDLLRPLVTCDVCGEQWHHNRYLYLRGIRFQWHQLSIHTHWKSTDISIKDVAFISRVEECAKHETSMKEVTSSIIFSFKTKFMSILKSNVNYGINKPYLGPTY
jgi:hypothetical protein